MMWAQILEKLECHPSRGSALSCCVWWYAAILHGPVDSGRGILQAGTKVNGTMWFRWRLPGKPDAHGLCTVEVKAGLEGVSHLVKSMAHQVVSHKPSDDDVTTADISISAASPSLPKCPCR
jgi:hypothetical protein